MEPIGARPWYTEFLFGPDDFDDVEVVWADESIVPLPVRKPTRAEKLSILLIGAFAIGWIVVMGVTLIVAVYISRHH